MATKPQTAKRSSGHVTVACKIPQGLRIVVPDDNGEPKIDVRLHGAASHFAVGGHGLTEVKADTWQAIVDHYKNHSGAKWLHNESVFVSADRDSASDKAEDRSGVNVGYDPIDPNTPGSGVRTSVTIQPEGGRDPGEGA